MPGFLLHRRGGPAAPGPRGQQEHRGGAAAEGDDPNTSKKYGEKSRIMQQVRVDPRSADRIELQLLNMIVIPLVYTF